MSKLWGMVSLAFVIVPGIVGAVPGQSGAVTDVQPAQAEVCGDLVSQAMCMTYTIVFGPQGVVSFTQAEAAWAVGTVVNFVRGGA